MAFFLKQTKKDWKLLGEGLFWKVWTKNNHAFTSVLEKEERRRHLFLFTTQQHSNIIFRGPHASFVVMTSITGWKMSATPARQRGNCCKDEQSKRWLLEAIHSGGSITPSGSADTKKMWYSYPGGAHQSLCEHLRDPPRELIGPPGEKIQRLPRYHMSRGRKAYGNWVMFSLDLSGLLILLESPILRIGRPSCNFRFTN